MITNNVLRVFLAAAALVAALALSGPGCSTVMGGGQNVPLVSSPRVPAARGELKARVTDKGNTEFQVKVEHLAPADRVAQGASTYVIWIQPMEGSQQPRNVGELHVSRDSLAGYFKGVTPYRRFELSITAEQGMAPDKPSNNQVLSAQVFQYEKSK